MKKIITFGLILLMSSLVIAYTDGQTVSQAQIDNWDTDKTFSDLWDDLECEIIYNADRREDTRGVYWYYQIDCWNVVIEEGVYTIREKHHSNKIYKSKYIAGLHRYCDTVTAECKAEYTADVLNKLKQSFKRRINGFLDKIKRWQTEAEPEDLTITF